MTDLKIFSNLKFIGYKQTAAPGKNGRALVYRDGIADWENVSLVTSSRSRDVIIDKKGNVVEFGIDNYIGIDTKPIPESTGEPQPTEFVKSTSINGTTSVSFTDQNDVVTTFNPNTDVNDFIFNFNSSDDWTEVGSSNIYFIDIIHNLNSDDITWTIYDTQNTGVLLRPTKTSNARLTITLNNNERFAGRIYIERAG